eukprot:4863043-Karenia_brevis.AAC.1
MPSVPFSLLDTIDDEAKTQSGANHVQHPPSSEETLPFKYPGIPLLSVEFNDDWPFSDAYPEQEKLCFFGR